MSMVPAVCGAREGKSLCDKNQGERIQVVSKSLSHVEGSTQEKMHYVQIKNGMCVIKIKQI